MYALNTVKTDKMRHETQLITHTQRAQIRGWESEERHKMHHETQFILHTHREQKYVAGK